MTTGQRIKDARKKAGMTQKELGEKLGVSFQTIAQWENDLRNPKIETKQRIANALGITLETLTGTSIRYDNHGNITSVAGYYDDLKPVIESMRCEESEEDIMATMLEATKDADPRIYNLLLEYQNLSDEQKELVVATARQFNVAKNNRKKAPESNEDADSE